MDFLDTLAADEGEGPRVTAIFEDESFLLISAGNVLRYYVSLMEGANNDNIARRVGVTAKYGAA